MKELFLNMIREEEGQGMAEYALVLGVIAVGVVGVLVTFGEEIMKVFNDVITSFQTKPTEPTT
ncbi:Flp family type IVb pilin [Piscibacillus salipiscarius]|uniref:Flp family type IVb pilin n=1 Tax=Piscibacillus salipiscarius TaxID=299480 RepID=A0ABW5QAH1_9BACI|nr:Flp family type IVb pilin [Piscibacillus salipiscarius]